MPLITIVSPVCNEERNIERFHRTVCAEIDRLAPDYEFEIIFTDNDSSDATRARVIELMERDPRVRYVKLARNFGYQRSIWTGYSLARGDAAIELDADLEDDPSHIPQMIEHWKDGAKIVYGIRVQRVEPQWLQRARKFFYYFIRRISDDDLPLNAGDFMLIDRSVLNYVTQNRDPNIYLRGYIFSLGFKRFGFEYVRNPRIDGVTKFNFRRLCGLAIDGIIRHSTIPLRLTSLLSALSAVVLILLAAIYVVGRLFFELNWPPGFATIVVVQMITFSMLSLSLGIMGEYVLRVYRILNHEPMTVIEYELEARPKQDEHTASPPERDEPGSASEPPV